MESVFTKQQSSLLHAPASSVSPSLVPTTTSSTATLPSVTVDIPDPIVQDEYVSVKASIVDLYPSPPYNDMDNVFEQIEQRPTNRNLVSTTGMMAMLPRVPLPPGNSSNSNISTVSNVNPIDGRPGCVRQPLARISSHDIQPAKRPLIVAKKSSCPLSVSGNAKLPLNNQPYSVSRLQQALTKPRPRKEATSSTSGLSSEMSSGNISNLNKINRNHQPVKCDTCGQELSSRCLLQNCVSETTCRRCGMELSAKCILSMCDEK